MDREAEMVEEVKRNLIQTIREAPGEKVGQGVLMTCLPGTNQALIVRAVNELQAAHQIRTFDTPDGLAFALEDEETQRSQQALSALSLEERLVYQTIEASSTTGVWIKTIQQRTNLASMNVSSIIQGLERKGLVKRARSKQRKKVYILASIEEKRSMIENDEGEVDQSIIDYYSERCLHFIKNEGIASTAEVCAFLRDNTSGFQDIAEADAQRFLDLLVFDGKIEQVQDYRAQGMLKGLAVAYRIAALALPPLNGVTEVPCSSCPVASQCTEGGTINPASCKYLASWLDDPSW